MQGEHAGQLNNINVKTEEKIKKWAMSKYTDLFKCTGRFNNHVVTTKFVKRFEAKQQKGRRIPIALQERVATEIERLIKEGHIERLKNCTENQFISPIVITVKRDGSLKIALDSKELNKAVCKNKYQMPNIEDLMDRIAELLSARKPGKIWFSSIDLRYAYRQLLLSLKTAEQCNFSLVGGRATGTDRFRTGFYGLADMPAEFQQARDRVLIGTKGTHAFIDDILICTKGSQIKNLREVKNVLEKLNAANVGLNIEKCKFMKNEIQWLGFELTQTGLRPMSSKKDSVLNIKPPRTLKQLKGLMGSAHQLTKFFPNLAQICTPFRPLLKSKTKLMWGGGGGTRQGIGSAKKGDRELHRTNAHLDVNAKTRVTCDASKSGLGAVLEQQKAGQWTPIAYASRFLNKAEEKNSINGLELLGVVWRIEHVKNYLLG